MVNEEAATPLLEKVNRARCVSTGDVHLTSANALGSVNQMYLHNFRFTSWGAICRQKPHFHLIYTKQNNLSSQAPPKRLTSFTSFFLSNVVNKVNEVGFVGDIQSY